MAIGSPQWMYASGEAYTIDQSLKFEDTAKNGTGSYLTRTPASAGNSDLWTYSCWAKGLPAPNANSHETQILLSVSGVDTNDYLWLSISNDGTLDFRQWDDSSGYFWRKISTALYRDPSSWYHYVVTYDSANSTAEDRIKMYVNGERITSFGTNANPSSGQDSFVNKTKLHAIGRFSINGVVQTDGALNGYLAEVNLIDGQALTPADFGETGDYGEWKPKEYSGTYGTNGFYLPFKNDYTVEGFSTVTYKGSGGANYIGGVGFKPDLTWIKSRNAANYHNLHDILRTPSMRLSSNATDAENNGSAGGATPQFSSFNNDGFSLSTSNENTNSSSYNYAAWNWDMGADTPTGFGCVTYTGSSSDLSVGGMTFSPDLVWIKRRNGVAEHFLIDSVRGNRRILNPDDTNAELDRSYFKSFDPDGFSVESGVSNSNNNGDTYVAWGWDMGGTSVANTAGDINSTVMANTTYGQSIVSWTGTGSGSSPTVGHGLSSTPEFIVVKHTDAVGVWAAQHKFDTTKYLQMQDVDAATTAATVFDNTAPTSSVFTINATNAVTNQSGGDYIAYCFHSVAGYSKIDSFSGSGVSGNTITTGFRPALLIVKQTNTAGENWYMFDSTREPLGELDTAIKLDETGAEATSSTKKVEFTDTGFKLNSTNSALNASGSTYIYLAFAGGMDSISDYNTDGSIDSRVKANTTYGQSIVSYTGNGAGSATVGHGLSSAPEMMIVRSRGSNAWAVYHTSMGNTHLMELNTTAAKADNNTFWNDTSPTSSAFTIGSHGEVNANNTGFIAYCWHSVTGYSKIGSYTGNGSTTGTTVTLGFRPAWLLIKSSTVADSWFIMDTTRSSNTTPLNTYLEANTSSDETSHANANINILDTGFQLKTAHESLNNNGGTYIYMAFADKRDYAYWLDQSGNNNDWTSNNLTESDISVDSPTNNFCTMNPLTNGEIDAIINSQTGRCAISEGNLKTKWTAIGSAKTYATLMPTSGKWYWEFYIDVLAESTRGYVGLGEFEDMDIGSSGQSGDSNYQMGVGNYSRLQAYGNEFDNTYSTPAQGDVWSFAVDWEGTSSKFWYRKNGGAWEGGGNPATGTTPTKTYSKTVTNASMCPYHGTGSGSSSNVSTIVHNFGQDSSFAGNKTAQGNQDSNDIGDFYYEPPTGFLALCTDNLPDVAVTPSEHFNTILYTGNNTANRSITGVGFAPDFIWAKERNNTAHHVLVDAVRGTSSGGRLSSNRDNAEDNTGGVTIDSFDSDGFTTGSSYAFLNGSTPFVAWNWKANGTGSSNTNGSITSTVSANTDAGFSIIKYHGNATAGATIGHGLSKAPELVICKDREAANGWGVGAFNENNTKALYLSSTGTFDTNNYWNSTNPSSTVITLGISGATNANNEMICYAWHSVDGYSKVGSYTGNGNADGTFVYTGFKPALVILKPASRTGHWMMTNNKSTTYNVVNKVIFANDSSPEYTNPTAAVQIDYLSNGFKVRTTDDNSNENNATYVFMAFAETPFKYSNGR